MEFYKALLLNKEKDSIFQCTEKQPGSNLAKV